MRYQLMKTIIAIVFSLMMSSGVVNGQEAAPVGTPAAAPEQAFPEFSMVAIGDHPEGYFRDLEIKPGTSEQFTVGITNTGKIPVELRTYKANALSAINGGFAAGTEDEESQGATSWIEYPSQDLHLKPGEGQEITFSVSVPENPEPGQYISGLVVETAEPVAIPGVDLLDQIITYSISLSVVIPGEASHDFSIGDPQATSNITVEVPVLNSGNYLVRPAGELSLTSDDGTIVHQAQVQMGSVYAGLETTLLVILPEQIAPGDYLLSVELVDSESGSSAELTDAAITLSEPADPKSVSVLNALIEPNAEEIVFANVNVTLNNGGQEIPASNVTLEIMRDGEEVDSFPLATNQVLLNGENQFTTRYIPAEMWESGTYTFNIVVSAVDPNGGQETILLDEELDATIVVP